MTKQTYRFIILLLTGLLALVITWGISFSQDNSEELVLPNSLENIYPLPYDQVPQQASLEIDLPVGYQLTLIVDNYIIPQSEIQYVEATGVFIWRPGPGKTFETWNPGKHNVRISWDTITGLPDFGEYELSKYFSVNKLNTVLKEPSSFE